MELKAKISGIVSKLHRLINPPQEELTHYKKKIKKNVTSSGLDTQANLVAFQSPTTDLLTPCLFKS
jgi:hypothetical protein